MNINSRIARANFTGYASGAVTSFTGLREAPVKIRSYISPIQSGSGTPSPDNIRPISGVSECNVVRCGENILKTNGLTFANPSSTATANTTPRTWTRESYCAGISHNNYYNIAPIDGYSVNDNEIVVKSKNAAYGVNIPITLARGISGKITLNANVTGGNINVGFYKEDGTFISSNESSILPRTVSIPLDTFWAVLGFVPTISQNPSVEISFTDIMIELSDTSSSYEAYTGNTYTIQLGDTYYGGSLDVTNGVLTVTHANIASYNGEPINEPWLCSEAVYSEGTTPPIGSQVVYPLATPITVQLTPTQVEQLLGANNIFSDTGNVEVYYVTI